jgi:uncharacterized protein
VMPVVGVMARAPIPGRCKTRLAEGLGAEGAALLYRGMLLDTLDLFSAIPFDRRVVMAAPEHDGVSELTRLLPAGWSVLAQKGADLGERLTNAAHALAPAPVLLVSSDSPMLPGDAVARSLGFLERPGRVLLGPCDDGGYYLIGSSEVEPRLFEGIPWSTALVCSATRERCRELRLELHELPPTFDVDQLPDLARLRQELEKSPQTATHTRQAFAGLRGAT